VSGPTTNPHSLSCGTLGNTKGLPKEALVLVGGGLAVTASDIAGARYVSRGDARIVQPYNAA
jgi:hypothetical protein